MVTVIGITSLTNTPLFWALCVLLTQKQTQFLFGNNNHFMAQITNEILHKCSAAQFIGKIDLFTHTAAILNLKGVLSDGQGTLTQYLPALFWQRENFTVYFSGKRRSLLHPNTVQWSFLSHYNHFLGKHKEKFGPKRTHEYWACIGSCYNTIILLKFN